MKYLVDTDHVKELPGHIDSFCCKDSRSLLAMLRLLKAQGYLMARCTRLEKGPRWEAGIYTKIWFF